MWDEGGERGAADRPLSRWTWTSTRSPSVMEGFHLLARWVFPRRTTPRAGCGAPDGPDRHLREGLRAGHSAPDGPDGHLREGLEAQSKFTKGLRRKQGLGLPTPSHPPHPLLNNFLGMT